MKKLKFGHHYININGMENCQITDPPPKFGFPIYPTSHLFIVLHFLILCFFICNIFFVFAATTMHPSPSNGLAEFPS